MGSKHGFGRLYDNKGNYKYGTWKMNEMEGKCRFIYFSLFYLYHIIPTKIFGVYAP